MKIRVTGRFYLVLLLLALMRVLSGNLVRRNLQAALPHSHATLVALRIRLND